MAEFIFWLCLFLPVYAWIGYPLMLLLVPRDSARVIAEPPLLSVSIIIAAHNEARHIQQKVQEVLGQSHLPAELEIIVASDGSTDDTVALASAVGDPRVRVLDLPRTGKAGALNSAAEQARNAVLVFTDADNQWSTDTLGSLLAPMADPEVGCCSGTLVIPRTGSGLSIGDRLYRRYEAWVRATESRRGCMVSVDGALFALRRDLWHPVPAQVNDDFFLSTCAPMAGKRIVHAAQAVVFDEGVDETSKQFRRRVRVTVGGLKSLAVRRSLLNPCRHGLFAIALISHKFIRRLAPLLLIPLLIASCMLWEEGWFYRLAAAAQLAGYALGVIGLLDRRGTLPKLFRLAGFILITLVGMAVGVWQFSRGQRYSLWNPDQSR